MADRKLVLLNDLALQVKPETVKPGDASRIFVAGSNLVRMTLAELALPGAEMVWTDFRHSASLGALQAAVQAAGGLDRLVLAVDGEHGEAVFTIMCAVLTLLPPLRRRQASEIELICLPGKSATSLVQFVNRIRPQLSARGVGVSLEMLAEPMDRSPA